MGATLEQRETGSWGLCSFAGCDFSVLLTNLFTFLLMYYSQLLPAMVAENSSLMSAYQICSPKEAFPLLVQLYFVFLIPMLLVLQYHINFTEC